MKRVLLTASKTKNPVKKNKDRVNRPVVHKDRKKESKINPPKYIHKE